MITHIRTVGFKGFDLDEDIPQKVIYSGKNKSGKSSRAGAISIALCGHIPFSTAGKRPGDILDSFGSGTLISAVTVGGKEFGRKFSRNEKGVVSQTVQVDKKRASAENFAILLDRAGGPRIADVAEFMKQSAAKKVDTLFDLFPNPELSTIDTEIHNWKEVVSRLEKKKTGADSTVVRLTNSKQAIQIPAGSIASVQAEIKTVETQIADFEEQIKEAEIEEAKVETERKSKKDEERKDIAATERQRVLKEINVDFDFATIRNMEDDEWIIYSDKEIRKHQEKQDENQPPDDPLDTTITQMENQLDNFKAIDGFDLKPGEVSEPFLPDCGDDGNFVLDLASQVVGPSVSESIQRIIEALNGAGCGTCAALIVAKQELKKFKGDL